jgi:16S rRNA (guanine(966)-N(2))-methyltransferase RsmD
MRIIGGIHKGKTLILPRTFKARPTTDFAKESLFNILQNIIDFDSVNVLDIFAGTGGISFEFASRGCKSVDVVEIEPAHFNYIRQTAKDLGFAQIRVIRNDAFKFLKFCTETYDVIFADPPYESPRVVEIPELVKKHALLKPGGRLILEHSSQHDFSQHSGFMDIRRYGGVNFSFFE